MEEEAFCSSTCFFFSVVLFHENLNDSLDNFLLSEQQQIRSRTNEKTLKKFFFFSFLCCRGFSSFFCVVVVIRINLIFLGFPFIRSPNLFLYFFFSPLLLKLKQNIFVVCRRQQKFLRLEKKLFNKIQ
jgi:hypothetical protein